MVSVKQSVPIYRLHGELTHLSEPAEHYSGQAVGSYPFSVMPPVRHRHFQFSELQTGPTSRIINNALALLSTVPLTCTETTATGAQE